MENYFNYFTEIEESFRICRAKYWNDAPLLLSSLDWALIESWKEAGIPLEAALIGIDRAFQKFAKRSVRFRKINGLAYCSQAVLKAAEELNAAQAQGGTRPGTERVASAPFSSEEISTYLERNAKALEQASEQAGRNLQLVLAEDLTGAARTLRGFAARGAEKADFEELERSLTALEEKVTASLARAASVEDLAQSRAEVEQGLARYRQKMSAAQIDSLERQFIKKRLFERHRVPRLSLFYL